MGSLPPSAGPIGEGGQNRKTREAKYF